MNEFQNQSRQPVVNINRDSAHPPVQHPVSGGLAKQRKSKLMSFKVLSILFLGSITVLLIALIVYIFVYKNNNSVSSQVKTAQYQAVFLNSSDGQVYFG